LVSKGGLATSPLIIVGVVVAYLTTLAVSPAALPGSAEEAPPAASPQPT
jgi:hypothetical protein